jgi:hypothetical protein
MEGEPVKIRMWLLALTAALLLGCGWIAPSNPPPEAPKPSLTPTSTGR